MRRTQKAEFQAPDISFFGPSLADQLYEREGNSPWDNKQPAKWQPRWTILFSLSAGVALWTGIIWLIHL
jgi:hypothetical protein